MGEEDKLAESDGDSEEMKDDNFIHRKGKEVASSSATQRRRTGGVLVHDRS